MNFLENGISIFAVGDILLSDGYFDVGYGMGSQIEEKGDLYPFEKLLGLLKGADFLIGNLECAISDKSPMKGLRAKEFLASPSVVRGLKQSGFNLLSIANNHTLQHGVSVFRETKQYIEEAGIKAVGFIPDGEKSQELVAFKHKERIIGFLSYSLTNDEHNTVVKEYAHSISVREIIDQVKENLRECNFLIVSLHWGEEFVSFPSAFQIDLAHQLIDVGVDAIIGHHPHVLQGIENYKGKTIAYSLGNFVFNMPLEICCQTAILYLNILFNGTQKAELIPVWINQYGQPEIPCGKLLNNIETTIELNSKNLNRVYPEDKYNEMIKIGLSKHRKCLKKQFVKNIHRLDKRWLLQMLYEYLRRRISNSNHT